MTTVESLRSVLTEEVIKITRKEEKKFNKNISAKDKKLSEKERAIIELTKNENFGCYTEKVIDLIAILSPDVDKKIIKKEIGKEDEEEYPPDTGSMVVPLDNPNSHDYKIGTCVLLGEDNRALKRAGSKGNNLPIGTDGIYGTTWRFATNEEIKDYFASLKLLSDDNLLELLLSVD